MLSKQKFTSLNIDLNFSLTRIQVEGNCTTPHPKRRADKELEIPQDLQSQKNKTLNYVYSSILRNQNSRSFELFEIL